VIHEKSIEFLEELPEIFHHRYRVFFSIPFRLMIGPYYSLGDDFRGRIAYNLPYFKAVEDAFTLAIPSTAIIRDFFKFAPDLLNPRKTMHIAFSQGQHIFPCLCFITKASCPRTS
jgi:hypothetical protein